MGWMESKQVQFPNKKEKRKAQAGKTQLAARAQKAGGLLAGQ